MAAEVESLKLACGMAEVTVGLLDREREVPADLGDVVLIRLAHAEDEEVLAGIDAGLQGSSDQVQFSKPALPQGLKPD